LVFYIFAKTQEQITQPLQFGFEYVLREDDFACQKTEIALTDYQNLRDYLVTVRCGDVTRGSLPFSFRLA
jgi:hypothetical protein